MMIVLRTLQNQIPPPLLRGFLATKETRKNVSTTTGFILSMCYDLYLLWWSCIFPHWQQSLSQGGRHLGRERDSGCTRYRKIICVYCAHEGLHSQQNTDTANVSHSLNISSVSKSSLRERRCVIWSSSCTRSSSGITEGCSWEKRSMKLKFEVRHRWRGEDREQPPHWVWG